MKYFVFYVIYEVSYFLLVHPEISLMRSGAKCGFEPFKQHEVLPLSWVVCLDEIACVSPKTSLIKQLV